MTWKDILKAILLQAAATGLTALTNLLANQAAKVPAEAHAAVAPPAPKG